MRMKGKKSIFTYKDTYSLDSTLAPIILEGLKKFKGVIMERNENDRVFGVPIKCHHGESEQHHTEEERKEALAQWLSILDTMIYAFDRKNEPSMDDYNFTLNMVVLGRNEEDETSDVDIKCDNEEEYQRFRRDEEEHHERVKEGHRLFGEFFDSLWW